MREQTTLRLPGELLERLRGQAQAKGVSVNQLLVTLILQALHPEA